MCSSDLASMFGVYHGPDGLKKIAQRIHALAVSLGDAIVASAPGVYSLKHKHFFDTIMVNVPRVDTIKALALAEGINLRYEGGAVGISIDETTTMADVEALAKLFARAVEGKITKPAASVANQLPAALIRESNFMIHPVFNRYHSEQIGRAHV